MLYKLTFSLDRNVGTCHISSSRLEDTELNRILYDVIDEKDLTDKLHKVASTILLQGSPDQFLYIETTQDKLSDITRQFHISLAQEAKNGIECDERYIGIIRDEISFLSRVEKYAEKLAREEPNACACRKTGQDGNGL